MMINSMIWSSQHHLQMMDLASFMFLMVVPTVKTAPTGASSKRRLLKTLLALILMLPLVNLTTGLVLNSISNLILMEMSIGTSP